MRVRTYVLIASIAMLFMSFGSKEARPVKGLNPGDIAPRIKSLGNEKSFSFQKHSGHYILLNFWAAYDAESRARNVQLMNEINQFGSNEIVVYSVSFDEKKSVFSETIKNDGLDETTQFHEELGKVSEVYKEYRLKKGFGSYLIDDQGVIVASNLLPGKLTEVLNRLN
ncbi:hypothetical protein D0T51_00540 [Parabacteroides sp. 52]|uniref:thioredoxin-like domain-containing protein n=1 Tax=unclassified Parabacteroides TaxID=2649774 RepID=UPI0013D62C98|nr:MULTISPECIES: thioredoxin-like domain-containing protein [unclassified Parabacteroides]MDH6533469.1 peroxiredoxin [Parabacteroides sp. PM5-20]NDV54225.1 hypothetical protein [Parabacteroides sp. 52]